MDDLDFFADARSVRARPVPAQDTDPLTDHDAEVAILGACLMDAARFHEVAPLLRATDFDLPKHGTIWEAYVNLAARGVSMADVQVTVGELRRMERLNTIGGAQYIGDLTDALPTGAHARQHAVLVASLARQRRLRDFLRSASARVGKPGADVDAVLAMVVQELATEGSRATHESSVCTAAEAVQAVSRQRERTIARRAKNALAWTGVPQPLGSLRRIMGGWQPQELTVLAAGTSVGKTAFALQCVAVAAGAGAHVLVASLEMNRIELTQRVLAAEASVSTDIVAGRDTGDDEAVCSLSDALRRVAGLPFTICDGAQQTVGSILALCHALRAKGADLQFVVVDYLQLMDADARRKDGTREQEVSEIGRGLKNLAKSARVHVLALSQENDDGRLRESRALEQHANNILKLRREEDPPAGEPCEPMSLIIEKHRNGARNAKLPVVYTRATTTFRDEATDFDDGPRTYEGETLQ